MFAAYLISKEPAMKPLHALALTLALGLSSVSVLNAQDAKPARVSGVTGDFALIADQLTPEQKAKIATLHAEALTKIKEIQAKEKADTMDVLTAEQKDALAKVLDERKASRRKGAAKPAGKATTKPADDAM
jgi:hypothetical protein